MNTDEIKKKILGCAYCASNELGVGFLEKVYENALFMALKKQGLDVEKQKPLYVYYAQQIVGDFFVDLLVQQSIIVELKATKAIDKLHQAQLLNYLKATGLYTGLLLNLGTPRLGIKRMKLGNEAL